MINYFYSDKAKILSRDNIIKYLKKNKLLEI